MTNPSKPQKPMGLNEWAYTSIRYKIINNEIAPGTQLNIENLSQELMISRTPIREALLRLCQDGLVRSSSRVGFFVCGMTRKEFLDVYELRTVIEVYSAEQAALFMSNREIAELDAITHDAIYFKTTGRLEEYFEADDRFHGALTGSLHNDKLLTTMDGIAGQIHRFRIYLHDAPEQLDRAIVEHMAVIEGVKAKDPQRAREAMLRHQNNNRDFLIERVPLDEE